MNKKKKQSEFVKNNPENKDLMETLLLPVSIVLAGVIIAVSVLYGSSVLLRKDELVTKSSLRTVLTDIIGNSTLNPTTSAPTPTPQTTASIEIGNAPKKGDMSKNRVVLVEVTDYECPFCKQFHTQTLPSVKDNYINNGKISYVVMEGPLSFHEPLASYKSNAALCMLDQKGDEKYFEFASKLFEMAITNKDIVDSSNSSKVDELQNKLFSGQIADKDGREQLRAQVVKDKLDPLVKEGVALGADQTKFNDCVKNGTFISKVDERFDLAYTAFSGGTPRFILGRIDDKGVVTGNVIVGAVPFDTMKASIDQELAK